MRVGSRISGRVQRLAANVGDRVERGQVIAELETAEYDAAVAEREAEFRLAESVLAAAEAFDPGSVAQAEAAVTRAEGDAVLERQRVTGAQFDAARRALELARSGGTEQRRQAEAARDRARAATESARVERSFASIRARADPMEALRGTGGRKG